jgi:hypothetical protein
MGEKSKNVKAAEAAYRAAALKYGAEGEATLKAKQLYGIALCDAGRLSQARTIQEELVEHWANAEGLGSYNTIRLRNDLAITLRREGQLERAREIQEELLKQFGKLQGPDSRHDQEFRLALMRALAGTMHLLEDWTNLDHLEDKLVDESVRVLGPYHPITVRSMERAAITKDQLQNRVAAMQLRESVLMGYIHIVGLEDRETLIAALNLAIDKAYVQDFDSARRLVTEHSATAERVLPSMSRLRIAFRQIGQTLNEWEAEPSKAPKVGYRRFRRQELTS